MTIEEMLFSAAFHQAAAAWAQAVFSVLAIVAAIWVSRREHRAAADLATWQRREDRYRKYDAVHAIAVGAQALVTMTVKQLQREDTLQGFLFEFYEPSEFDDANEALRRIPLHELGSYSMVLAIQALIKCVEKTKRFADGVYGQPGEDPSYDVDEAQKYLASLEREACVAESTVREVLTNAYKPD